MTGYGVTDAWTAATFGVGNGSVGQGCVGLGYEPGDVNLQFVRIEKGYDAVKIDSGVSIVSIKGVTLELTFELNSGGSSLSFMLKNVDTDTTLSTAIVQLPTPATWIYTINAGIGNRGVAIGGVKLAILHMLFAHPPGSQPA